MFKNLLSPAANAELERRRAELTRLYPLSDLLLANELQRLAEAARLERPNMTPDRGVYDSSMLWTIIPEVSRRLGASASHNDTALMSESPKEFRRTVGIYLRWVSHYELGAIAWNLLASEPCNGNPLVFAVDRLCAGDLDDPEDWITRSVKEVAHFRGTPYEGVWTPAVMKNGPHAH